MCVAGRRGGACKHGVGPGREWRGGWGEGAACGRHVASDIVKDKADWGQWGDGFIACVGECAVARCAAPLGDEWVRACVLCRSPHGNKGRIMSVCAGKDRCEAQLAFRAIDHSDDRGGAFHAGVGVRSAYGIACKKAGA